jgi:hypothetical protein
MANLNSFDPAAVSVDGARHRGELWRNLAYAATNGAEGVVGVGDCKPRQLATAGPQVRLDAGAVVFLNRSANAGSQAYIANNRSETRLDVAPTGASPRSDAIVVRVKDPQYSPWPTPGSPADYQYVEPVIIQGVPATTTHFSQLNLGYSGYMFGRIDLPANTTNITTAMIVGTRRVANQRREPWFGRFEYTSGTPENSITSGTSWNKFPVGIPTAQIAVPDFATKMVVRADITGLAIVTGAYRGNWRFHLTDNTDWVDTQLTYANEQVAASQRLSFHISDMVEIPAGHRGKTVQGYLQFAHISGPGNFRADTNVQVSIDIDFFGAAI